MYAIICFYWLGTIRCNYFKNYYFYYFTKTKKKSIIVFFIFFDVILFQYFIFN